MSPAPDTPLDPASSARLRRQALLAAAAGAATVPTMVLWRDLPWSFATVVGLAVGILVWSTLQSAVRLRRQLRRDERL